MVDGEGARAENLVASHLLKSVNFWTDIGMGEFDLYYVRDKDQREVDFLVTKNDQPWILVEVKLANSHSISSSLRYWQKQLQPEYALQVVMDMPYEERSCFVTKEPIVVPTRTFLSQLV